MKKESIINKVDRLDRLQEELKCSLISDWDALAKIVCLGYTNIEKPNEGHKQLFNTHS